MKLLLALVFVLLMSGGCTTLKRAGAWVCERETTISAGITSGGEKLSGIVGPAASVLAWGATTLLDATCDLFDLVVNVPGDLGTDAMSPFTGDDDADKKSDPPGK